MKHLRGGLAPPCRKKLLPLRILGMKNRESKKTVQEKLINLTSQNENFDFFQQSINNIYDTFSPFSPCAPLKKRIFPIS